MLSSRLLLSYFRIRGLAALLLSLFCAAALAVSAQAANNPVPYVDIVTPTSIAPGSATPTLTVRGTGYVSGSSTVYWNGVALATTFVSAKMLTATVPTALVAAQGFGSVTVATVAPGGGTSNAVYVPVGQHLLATSFPATPSFTYSVGSAPTGLATADFNGDGKIDLAIANSNDTTVSILVSNGDGTFTVKPTATAGTAPNWIATGDFNGDGKVDLAVVNIGDGIVSSTVSILLGNGDGTFTLKSSPSTGISPYAVATGDFNGDGKLDLAVTNTTDGTVTILLGNGDGTFTAGTSPAVGSLPVGLVVGDFNEDGVLDIVVANNGDNTVSMLLGNGDGTFQAQTTTAVGGSGAPLVPVAGDFNGDAHLDVAVANTSDVAILLGDGTGVLTLNTNPSVGVLGASLDSEVAGDFNDDGKPGVVVGDNSLGGFLFPGNGDGTFGASVGFDAGAKLVGAVTADLDGDGALDLAFTDNNASGHVSILLQTVPVSLAPTSLSFGNQGINTGVIKSVRLTNNSASTVNISSIAIAGANASDFIYGTTCGPTVLTTVSCIITVTFTPTTLVAESATLSVTDDADGSPQVLALSGTGIILPQTIVKSFGAATVVLNGSTSLSFTITNPNAGSSLTNIAFTDTLPAGLTVSSPNGLTGTCGSGVITAVANSASVSLSGATLAASGTCTFSVNVTGITVGVQNNSVTSTSTQGGTGNTSTASVTVVGAPVLAKSFGAASIGINSSTTLTFTVTNPSASIGLTGVAFTDNLPAGMVVSTPNGLTGTCGAGTITAVAGSTSVVLAGGTVAASGSCTFTVNVTGTAGGTLVNTTAAITSTNGGTGNTATASLTVTVPDLVITKTHTGNFQQGQTGAVYTISVSNTGTASTVGLVTVVDTLPTGLTATAFSGTGWTCVVGTATCTRSDVLAANGVYPPLTLTVSVSATAAASLTNSVTVSGGGETNVANDTATNLTTIVAPDLVITKTHTGNFQQGQTGAVYTISVSNTGTASTVGLVTVVDTLPTGLTATAFSGTGWTCVVGTATCTRSDVLAANGVYPPLTLTVNVSGTAAASLTNSVTVSGGGESNIANDTATSPTTITAVQPDFSITAAPTTASVAAGASATYTLTITPLNNIPFTTAITLTASGAPGQAVASFVPATVTPGSAAATDSLVVTTSSGAVAANIGWRSAPIFAVLGMPLAGIFLVGFGSRKRKWLGRSGLWMVLLVVCAGFVFWGCASAAKGTPTPAGTYTISVTATGGTATHTTPVTLTVTQ